MSKQQKQGGKKNRKYGRSKRKQAACSNPLSKYVRNIISFEQYYKLVGKSH